MSASDASVAVIGGGVVGLACALSLQRAGREVVLIDPHTPATRASTASAGIVGGLVRVMECGRSADAVMSRSPSLACS